MSTFTIGPIRTVLVEVEAPNVEAAIEAVNYIKETDASQAEERDELGFRIGEIKLLEHNAVDATDS